jgi:hypothetical protein
VPRLTARVALLEQRGLDGTARAGSWLAMLAPASAAPDAGSAAFPPRLARHLVAELRKPQTRGKALGFLDALADFARSGDPVGS